MSLCLRTQVALKVLTCLSFVLSCSLIQPDNGHSFELLLGTGEAGSFSHFAGKAVCRAINKTYADLSCRSIPSDNYTDNLTNVQSGSLDMALINSKMIYDAFHSEGLFEYVTLDYAQLRLLMPVYRLPISLLIRKDSDIASISDLYGKKVNRGAPFSLQSIVFNEIMTAEGWDENNFTLLQTLPEGNAQDFIALHSGFVQAMLHVGMHPARRVQQSLASKYTDLIAVAGDAMDRLIESRSGFYLHSIPAATYPGYDREIKTLALEVLLVTSADTDEDVVNQVLAALYAEKRRLQNAHPSLLKDEVNVEILNNSYLHPHPGALLFFQVNQNRF